MSQDKLQDWKDAHCNDDNILIENGACYSKAYPEVTFGNGPRCTGCPYLSV